MNLTISVSWPGRVLSPNGRVNKFRKAEAKRIQKEEAYLLTLQELRGEIPSTAISTDPVAVKLTYHAPTANEPDDDNIRASLKSAFDGMALALRMNDKRFRFVKETFGKPGKPGKVIIQVIN